MATRIHPSITLPLGGAAPKRRPALRAGIAGLIAVALAAGLARQLRGGHWVAVPAQLRAADPALVLLALAAFAGAFLARAIRWRVLLRNADPSAPLPPFAVTAGIMLRAWCVNTLAVAQAGDAYRAYLLHRRAGAPVSRTLGTVLAERLVDLLALAAILVPATLLAFGGAIPAVATWVLGLAIAVVAAGAAVLALLPRIVRRFEPLAESRPRVAPLVRLATGTSGAIGRLPLLLALSLGGWAGECLTTLLAARAAGVVLPVPVAAAAALSAALLTALPVTPGGLGVADAGLLLLLSAAGIPAASAAAVVVLVRAIAIGTPLVAGGAAWLFATLTSKRDPTPIGPRGGGHGAPDNHAPLRHRGAGTGTGAEH